MNFVLKDKEKRDIVEKKSFSNSAPITESPVNLLKILLTSGIGSIIFIIGAFLYFNYGYIVRNFIYDFMTKYQ